MKRYLKQDSGLTFNRGIVEECPNRCEISKRALMAGLRDQEGRSLLEILSVLAIIGVLSIAALAGISYGFRKVKTNAYLDYLNTLKNGIFFAYEDKGEFNPNVVNEIKTRPDIVKEEPILCDGNDEKYFIPLSAVPKTNCLDLLTYMERLGCHMAPEDDSLSCGEDTALCADELNDVKVICSLESTVANAIGTGTGTLPVGTGTENCSLIGRSYYSEDTCGNDINIDAGFGVATQTCAWVADAPNGESCYAIRDMDCNELDTVLADHIYDKADCPRMAGSDYLCTPFALGHECSIVNECALVCPDGCASGACISGCHSAGYTVKNDCDGKCEAGYTCDIAQTINGTDCYACRPKTCSENGLYSQNTCSNSCGANSTCDAANINGCYTCRPKTCSEIKPNIWYNNKENCESDPRYECTDIGTCYRRKTCSEINNSYYTDGEKSQKCAIGKTSILAGYIGGDTTDTCYKCVGCGQEAAVDYPYSDKNACQNALGGGNVCASSDFFGNIECWAIQTCVSPFYPTNRCEGDSNVLCVAADNGCFKYADCCADYGYKDTCTAGETCIEVNGTGLGKKCYKAVSTCGDLGDGWYNQNNGDMAKIGPEFYCEHEPTILGGVSCCQTKPCPDGYKCSNGESRPAVCSDYGYASEPGDNCTPTTLANGANCYICP